MRLILGFAFLCFCMFSAPAFGQVSKIVHQTFTIDDAESLNINVVAKNVEIKETKGSRILVETSVRISIPNERLLDYVVNSGRYNLEKTINPSLNELTLASKKSNNVIIVRGEECYEELSYTFYIPSSVPYVNNSSIQGIGEDE